MHGRGRLRELTGIALAVCLVASGCARFDDREATPFTPVPEADIAPAPAPPAQPESPMPPGGAAPPEGEPEEGPCVDPDPAVIATCLEPAFASIALGNQALVGDASGRLVTVAPDTEPADFAHVDVGEGHIAALAPSPAYEEDRLVFALVVGDGPSRIERVARGQQSVTITDLPEADAGGMVFQGEESLRVGLGNEMFTFDYDGIGDPGEPHVAPLAGTARGVCALGEESFVTVLTPNGAALQNDETVMWTWPDQREIGECSAQADGVALALPGGHKVEMLPLIDGIVSGEPLPLSEDRYGRFHGVTALADGLLIGTTINKAGGEPVETDDRAVVLEVPAGGDART